MQPPLSHRNGIPFFYDKSKVEFQKDIYERYHEMVLKHTTLHIADKLWGAYPMQAILDFGKEYFKSDKIKNILEVGCGVGRWIADMAKFHPQADCWGIDNSYQMLKRANEFWVKRKDLNLDLSHKGFETKLHLEGSEISNVNFGLAKACDLPFDDQSQDIVCSSFLIDRLENPSKGILEMNRVLKSEGLFMMVTPLNFQNAEHWNAFYPAEKLMQFFTNFGMEILEWKENINIREPLDARGNAVMWKCLACIARKK